MNKISITIIIAILLLGSHNKSLCNSNRFISNLEPKNIDSPLEQLGIYWGHQYIGLPPFYIRQDDNKNPGDYYRYPFGAQTLLLNQTAKNQIRQNIQGIINPVYYDTFIIDSIRGYSYRLYMDSINREDCYVRYSQGDTIYVISGWLGKFQSFYRAVPGIIKFDYGEFQKEIFKLSLDSIKIPQKIFQEGSKSNPYFIQYIDRDKMLRIRCYHIVEIMGADEINKHLISNSYTLIEITKFLDKEVMP